MCLCTGMLYNPNTAKQIELNENKNYIYYSGGLDTSYCLMKLSKED